LIVPAIADMVAVSEVEADGSMRPVALRHADPLLGARTDLLLANSRWLSGRRAARAA
jgi:hypothetical protein